MRKLSVPIYLTAFVISLIIFLSGIYVGSLIDNSNLEGISGDVESISQKVSSVQLLLLMEGNSSSFCPVYTSELDNIDTNVEEVGHKLSYLEEEKQVFDNELKKQYFVLQAESYLLSKRVKEVCGDNSVLLINFYSNKDCNVCSQQGGEILKARDSLIGKEKVKLYSFDGELGSPVADAFKVQYNVSSYPSIVVDGKTYPGYHDSVQIMDIIQGTQ
jgi:hypothetical protein